MGFASKLLDQINELDALLEKHHVTIPEEVREKLDEILSDVYEEYEYEREDE